MPLSYYPEFLTATILRWQHLLKDDSCKQIIIDSLEWLVANKKCKVWRLLLFIFAHVGVRANVQKILSLSVPLSYYPEFLTATILRWQHLLKDDSCKQIIIDSLEWLVANKKCKVYAFVIMPNHIHLIWKIFDGFTRQEVQGAFFSFTAHEFKKYLKEKYKKRLSEYFVNDSDRTYQFWERDSLVKECFTQNFTEQKMEYIHQNPCKTQWNLAIVPEEYKWSSALFYFAGDDQFKWLSHINE